MCVCSALVYLFDSVFIDVHTIEQCPAGNVNKLIEYRFVLSDCHLASTCTRTRWPLKIEPIESNRATLFIYEKKLHCWILLICITFWIVRALEPIFSHLVSVFFCSIRFVCFVRTKPVETLVPAVHVLKVSNASTHLIFLFFSILSSFSFRSFFISFRFFFFGVVHFTFNCVSKSTLSHCVRVCKCAIFKRSDGACKHSIISNIHSSARALRTSSRLHTHCLLPWIAVAVRFACVNAWHFLSVVHVQCDHSPDCG